MSLKDLISNHRHLSLHSSLGLEVNKEVKKRIYLASVFVPSSHQFLLSSCYGSKTINRKVSDFSCFHSLFSFQFGWKLWSLFSNILTYVCMRSEKVSTTSKHCGGRFSCLRDSASAYQFRMGFGESFDTKLSLKSFGTLLLNG